MKKLLSLLLLATCLCARGQFALTNIYMGVGTNTGTGDRLNVAFPKVNTNFWYVTNLVTVVSNSFIATSSQVNWALNTLYSNSTDRLQTVSGSTVFTNAAVAGENEVHLYVGASAAALSIASSSGYQTLGTGIATTNFGTLFAPVQPHQAYSFSNAVVGAGNSSGFRVGTGFLIQH